MSNVIQINFDTEDTTVPESSALAGEVASSGLTATGPVLVGRATSGSGALEELDAAAVLDFLGLSEDDGVAFVDAPAAANSTGTEGSLAYDDDYFYVCTATDTWKRFALATWS